MMNKMYLVSDLAAELQIPRTTVNDWLRIYAAYLESDVRGKRRVYPERTLEILREIKAKRDGGAGQSAIEAMLAERYGIRPEPVTAPDPEEEPETPPAPAEEPPAGSALVRPDPELKEFFLRWQQNELEQRKRTRRSARLILCGLAVILVLFGAALCLTVAYFNNLLRLTEKTADQRQFAAQQAIDSALQSLASVRLMQENAERKADARSAELKRLTVTLDRNRAEYQRDLARIAEDMKRQKAAADRALAELRKTEAGRREAEIAELKRAFAEHQATLLKEMEAAQAARLNAEKLLAEKSAAEKAAEEAKKTAPVMKPEEKTTPDTKPEEKPVPVTGNPEVKP